MLLAEGSALRRALLVAHFEGDGFHVDAVQDGLEALDLLEDLGAPGDPSYPDLLVVGCRLAGLGGVDVLQGLRMSDAVTPVIVVAESADPDTRQRVLELGCAVLLVGSIAAGDVRVWARRLLPVRA